MNDKLKDLIKEALGVTIWEIVKCIFGLIFTVTSSVFASRLLISFVSILAQFKWYLAVIFATGSAWIFLVLYQRISKFHPTFPRLDFDFHILEKEITYEYKDKTHMVYRRRALVKALKNGLDAYYDKYQWTGTGNVKISSAIKEHQFRETIKKNVWQFYEIRFQKTLSKKESMDTELIWELKDTAEKAVPFFSATIEEPTDYLKLNLSLPCNIGVREVTCEVSSGIGAKKPFSSKTILLDRNGKATWEIRKPKLLYHYEMKWSF